MKRFFYMTLFFVAGMLIPLLIWVDLLVALRRPLLRAMRRAAAVALALLVGITFPVFIWVGLFAAIRQPLLQTMRRIAYAPLFFLVAVLMPVLILVAFGIVSRELLFRWCLSRLPSSLVQRFANQLPPGYVRLSEGRLVPQY